ncbi:SCO family protein [Bosea massiliensis]|uniref:SCO family protein n=1 Tax=Bosea massiliensis TaxID=151419 RepID=A0ABW0P9W3_9HYPH
MAVSGAAQAVAQSLCVATPVSLKLRDTALVDHRGRRVKLLSDLIDRPGVSVISFVYTGCQSYCPPASLIMQMVDGKAAPDVRLASVTIDPLTDQPDVLAVRAREMGASERWAWLTGEPSEVFDLLDRVGVSFGRIEDHDVVFLIAGGGRLLRFRSLPDPDQILCVVRKLAAR